MTGIMKPINDHFWKVIDEARALHGNPDASLDADVLKKVLSKLSDDEVIGFMKEFYQALINLNNWPLWGAGFVVAGGMSDDGFHYFRSWIIGRGKDAYEMAMTNPDGLGPFLGDDDELDNELLEYVALDVLESRGNETDPREDFEESADDAPTGEAWDEDSVFELYPSLVESDD